MFLRALHDASEKAGAHSFISNTYHPCDVLILYGLGGHDRLPVAERHCQSGRPFVAWDLGYWGRTSKERVFRFSINSNHPFDVMGGDYPDPARFESAGLPLRKVYDPGGPVLLIGNGPKSKVFGTAKWANRKSREIRQAFPGKKLVYRPKPGRTYEQVDDYDYLSDGPIEDALCGVSLVVCRHSNVAVDACRSGVPVVCDGGAATAIYPNTFDGIQPSESIRKEFLHRLAWWQWSSGEALQAWDAMRGKLEA